MKAIFIVIHKLGKYNSTYCCKIFLVHLKAKPLDQIQYEQFTI